MNNDAKMIFLAVALLVMMGLVMIYSSSAIQAYKACGDSAYFVKRHLFFLTLGLGAAVFAMTLPVNAYRDHARGIMFVSILLLVAVLIPGIGVRTGGARRWIHVLGTGFQPSEFAKLALIVYLAEFTARKRHIIADPARSLVPAFAVIGLTGGLILLEPDLGTAVAASCIGLTILFVSGMNLKYLFGIMIAAVPLLSFAIIAAPYRMQRITAFWRPWDDPAGKGFQLIQSFIALGSGGILGVGLGESRQKLFYLPQSHTDFIYSIVGEELGFLGATAVLVLFAALVGYILRLALRLRDPFMSRAVTGVGIMIAFEAIVNIGVSTGMLPTKGLPLPFISYGGSSLVAHLAAIGAVLNISRMAE